MEFKIIKANCKVRPSQNVVEFVQVIVYFTLKNYGMKYSAR